MSDFALFRGTLSIKSTLYQSLNSMDELLRPVKTISTSAKPIIGVGEPFQPQSFETIEDIKAILSGKPDLDLLFDALRWLQHRGKHTNGDLDYLGSKIAEIRFTLLDKVIPDFWPLLERNRDHKSKKVKLLLLNFFSNVASVAFIASHFRLTLSSVRSTQLKEERKSLTTPLIFHLDFTAALLKPSSIICRHWEYLQGLSISTSKKALLWKEYIIIVAGGRMLSLTAEALQVASEVNDTKSVDNLWIADGKQYAKWLGENLSFMLKELKFDDSEGWRALRLLLSKALTLGYSSTYTWTGIVTIC